MGEWKENGRMEEREGMGREWNGMGKEMGRWNGKMDERWKMEERWEAEKRDWKLEKEDGRGGGKLRGEMEYGKVMGKKIIKEVGGRDGGKGTKK
jgi:hypothetical protein